MSLMVFNTPFNKYLWGQFFMFGDFGCGGLNIAGPHSDVGGLKV